MYVEYLFLINFFFDFIILLTISLILKRNTKLLRLILGSIFGGLAIVVYFIPVSNNLLIFIKLLFGILMIVITFNFVNLKYTLNNIYYLFVISILLGGSLYLLRISVNNKIHIVTLMLISIFILLIYLKKERKYKKHLSNYYEVDIYINNCKYNYKAYLDTGNKLYDPYFHRPIILISNWKFKFDKPLLVPYKALNHTGIITCMKVDKVYIHNIGYKYNVLVGRSIDKFRIDGIDMILHEDCLEG